MRMPAWCLMPHVQHVTCHAYGALHEALRTCSSGWYLCREYYRLVNESVCETFPATEADQMSIFDRQGQRPASHPIIGNWQSLMWNLETLSRSSCQKTH